MAKRNEPSTHREQKLWGNYGGVAGWRMWASNGIHVPPPWRGGETREGRGRAVMDRQVNDQELGMGKLEYTSKLRDQLCTTHSVAETDAVLFRKCISMPALYTWS